MVVIAEKWFQLGNRVFAMGHFIASAIDNGFTVVNPAFEDYAEHFVATRADPWCRFPVKQPWLPIPRMAMRWLDRSSAWTARTILRHHLNTRLLRAVAVGIHDEYPLDCEEFRRWAKKTWVLLAHGWSFRDPGAFNRHGDEIRAYFTPVPELLLRVASTIAKAQQGCDVLVGMHLRQGDYKQHFDGKYYFETRDYVRLMGKIAGLFPERKVGFLVCSNAPQDPAAFGDLRWMKSDGHLVVDMYALAKCDYIVGPPSTFSQWASFYGQTPLCMVRSMNEPVALDRFVVFKAGMSHV
jgi:hypothetical protein